MAIYHLSIKVISKSRGASAVAKAAYRSGQKLHNERTGLSHDFTKKHGVVHSEVMLCRNAPKEYRDREILWNAVERIEKNSNAQLAREIEFALPIEFDEKARLEVAREFLQHFVDEGMCVDWSYHNKEFGKPNPHIHAMLTMRGIRPDGSWDSKEKKAYALDPDGERIPIIDPKTGKQKIGKNGRKMWKRENVQKNDWNSRDKAEEWRKLWADTVNRKMKELGFSERIDHRSYERQGIDLEPTIHEGYTARQMERSGRISDRCRINRDIRKRNRLREQIRQTAREITEFILKKAGDFIERFRHLIGPVDDIRETGAASVYSRRTAERDRGIREREQRSEQRKRKSAETDRHIAETDRRIKELAELKQRKEAENNDRIRKLMERRRSHQDHGGTADGTGRIREADRFPFHADTGTVLGQLRDAESDTEAFLRELRAKEQSAAEKRRDRESERADRESFRQRQATERGRGQTGTMPAAQPEVRAEREGHKEPGRYRR